MLLLFALSVTPKQLLHDVATGHKHEYAKSYTEIVKSSKPGFQCNWDNELIESPFKGEAVFRLNQPNIYFLPEFSDYILRYYSAVYFFPSLRGPPQLS